MQLYAYTYTYYYIYTCSIYAFLCIYILYIYIWLYTSDLILRRTAVLSPVPFDLKDRVIVCPVVDDQRDADDLCGAQLDVFDQVSPGFEAFFHGFEVIFTAFAWVLRCFE